MRVHIFLCSLASLLGQQFDRLAGLFFYKSYPVIWCDHAIFFEWALTFLHVIHIQVTLPILEGLIRYLQDPLLDIGLSFYGNSEPLNPILPNVILVLSWHLTPIIMNDTDGFPSKASTSMCCWLLNLIRFHWHPISIDLLYYSNFGRYFVFASLLLPWLWFGLRGTHSCLGLMFFAVCSHRYRCLLHHATCSLLSAFICLQYVFGRIIVGA